MVDKKHIKLRGMIGLDDNATPEFLERGLADAGGGPVRIDINSPGGFVHSGLEMANMLRRYSGHVTVRVVGMAASMASYIPMMANTVEVEDNTVLIIHNPFGGTFGDYQAAEKEAVLLKGLARLLGKGYADKTGKSVEAIAQLMDEETFFFGDEIVAEGFADTVVKGEGEGDKTKALAFAQGEIKACEELLKDAGKPVQYEKIAALMGGVPKTTEKTMAKTPEAPVPEAKKTLAEVLADNPEAKAEHEASIAKSQLEAKAAKIAEPLLKADYPDPVKAQITKLAQAGNLEGLQAFAAMHLAKTETANQQAAQKEQGEETPPEGPSGESLDGIITDASQMAGEVARFKAQNGIEGAK